MCTRYAAELTWPVVYGRGCWSEPRADEEKREGMATRKETRLSMRGLWTREHGWSSGSLWSDCGSPTHGTGCWLIFSQLKVHMGEGFARTLVSRTAMSSRTHLLFNAVGWQWEAGDEEQARTGDKTDNDQSQHLTPPRRLKDTDPNEICSNVWADQSEYISSHLIGRSNGTKRLEYR